MQCDAESAVWHRAAARLGMCSGCAVSGSRRLKEAVALELLLAAGCELIAAHQCTP